MMGLVARMREGWGRASRLDAAATVVAAAGATAAFVGSGGIFSFLKFLGLIAGIYLVVRLIVWARPRVLWSLRNRLIVAYVFIAVVPVLLLLILGTRSAQILYSQFGAYLLSEDINRRIEMMSDISSHIAAAHTVLPAGVSEEESERILAAQSHAVHDRELAGLAIDFSNNTALLKRIAGPGKQSFAGLLQEGDQLSMVAMREIAGPGMDRVVTLRVPVTPEFLATIAPDLGAIQLNLMKRYNGGPAQGVIYPTGGVEYEITGRIVAKNRALQPSDFGIDSVVPVNVVSRFDSVFVGRDGSVEPLRPVLAVFNARPSRLNARIFPSLGELRDTYLTLFVLVGIAFLIIETAALIAGIVLTRRITTAVNDLYTATQYVQAGDLSHRVRVERGDQLGVLGESFNSMTASIGSLIEEQSKRQRLENEISIAREVQDQLFPRAMPQVAGVELEAICKAARLVSGDYYDFIQLGPTTLAIAIADISGKGISAALLMASLQAALRSQVLVAGSAALSTAELVSRLNKHLVRNTGDDRFATFFIAVYDSATRVLRYTNAGHLPAFLISKEATMHLDEGGMVLGVVEDYCYEEGRVTVAGDSMLVGYSDGLVEPENVYGEEFGIRRLELAAGRLQNESPRRVAESLMMAAEEWAGTPEQADDMTVIVARLR